MRTYHAATALLAFAAACAPGLPEPAPSAMDPAWGWNGETTDVVIRGSDFYPRVQAAGSRDVQFDRQFRGWLVSQDRYELDQVGFRGAEELRASVPPGLEAGRYDLEVVGPSGETGLLRGAFTVTDNRADHIELAATDLSWPVYSLARLDIQLSDPTGADVPDSVEVEVLVRGADDLSTVRFEETLDDQSLVFDLEEGRVGVRGHLGPDGRGHVTFTSTAPAELWIDVSPAARSSVVSGASQFLAFTPADAVAIEVAPVDPGATIIAGQPFDLRVSLVDAYGNVAGDASAGVTLFESCGTSAGRFTGATTVVGSTILTDVVLFGATTSGGGVTCADNQVDAIGNVFGSTITGSSAPLAITPGPVEAYEMDAWPPDVEAGADPVLVRVDAMDEVGNQVIDHDALVALSDNLGGLAWGPDAWSCDGFSAGTAECIAYPVVAGAAVAITATDADGKTGTAPSISVHPSDPADLLLSGPTGAQAAGAPFSADMQARDEWGNGVSLDITGVDQPVFTDAGGVVGCNWLTSIAPIGTERFQCAPTRAETEKVLTAAIPSRGLLATTLPFEVTNGSLASVGVTLGATVVTAGDDLTVSLRATDEWDNAYRVQAITSVELWDESGDLTGASVALDAGGLATVSQRLTSAWDDNEIEVRAGSTTLGRSDLFNVEADAPVGIAVEPARTWSWVDEALAVNVTVIDDFDNPVTSYAGSVTLVSSADAGDAVIVGAFVGGVAQAEFEWSLPLLQDTLLASDGTLTGESAGIDAIDDCDDGPTADLLVGGDTALVVCRSSGTTASTALTTSASAAGTAALAATHFAANPDDWARVVGTSTTTAWTDTGSWLVQAVVVDEDACADTAAARIWVAENDGEPAGPITVETADSELVAGSAVSGATAVTIIASDCAGDPSSGGLLQGRVELGTLATGTSTLTSSGDGLTMVLDGDGEANLSWSVVNEFYAGSPALHVGRDGQLAYGATSVTVTGDAALPVVLDVTPAGTSSDVFSHVEVTFSEPMLSSTLSTSTVALTEPTGVATAGTVTLSLDQTTLTYALSNAQDSGSGIWTFAVGSNVRDQAGNRLDGEYSGVSGAFSLEFGDVPDSAPDTTACVLASSIFRPDGDPGAGAAADAAEITVTADASPAWWELEVTDGDGDLVYLWRTAGVGTSAVLTWDGRGQDGLVVANGSYAVTLTGLDDSWNAGASCGVNVSAFNRIHPPE